MRFMSGHWVENRRFCLLDPGFNAVDEEEDGGGAGGGGGGVVDERMRDETNLTTISVLTMTITTAKLLKLACIETERMRTQESSTSARDPKHTAKKEARTVGRRE